MVLVSGILGCVLILVGVCRLLICVMLSVLMVVMLVVDSVSVDE